MLKWLKKKIRDWLLEDTPKKKQRNNMLDCMIDGEKVTYRIIGTCGAYLQGESSLGWRMIGIGVACDQDHYQQLWDDFHKDSVFKWVDEPSDKPQ